MSIAQELINSETFLKNAYAKLQEKGATMPEKKTLQNLAATIDSVTGAGITFVDYIESTGTQYIDTGFKPNPTTTKVEVKMAFTNNAVSTQGAFGARPTSSGLDTGSCNLFWNIDVGKVRPDWCGEHNNAYSVEVALNEPILITCENRTVTIDGTQKTGSFTKGTNYLDYSMYIGSFNNAGSMFQQGVYAKWYYFKIYDNGTLIRDFVPAKRNSDNVLGMYDRVNNQFYSNQGTGEFLYG